MVDPRLYYFEQDGFVSARDEEFYLSVTFEPGVVGPEGWSDGYFWHLESEVGTLCHYADLGGNPFCDVDHWLVPLTGYTREEFLALVTGKEQ